MSFATSMEDFKWGCGYVVANTPTWVDIRRAEACGLVPPSWAPVPSLPLPSLVLRACFVRGLELWPKVSSLSDDMSLALAINDGRMP